MYAIVSLYGTHNTYKQTPDTSNFIYIMVVKMLVATMSSGYLM